MIIIHCLFSSTVLYVNNLCLTHLAFACYAKWINSKQMSGSKEKEKMDSGGSEYQQEMYFNILKL